MKSTPCLSKKQHCKSLNLRSPLPLKQILSDPLTFLRDNLSQGELRSLNEILKLDGLFMELYFSQGGIAKKSKLTRETVNRIMTKFRAWGLVESAYRHMETCLYKVADIFRDIALRKQLKVILPCLVFLHWSALLSMSAPESDNSLSTPHHTIYIPNQVDRYTHCTNTYTQVDKYTHSPSPLFKNSDSIAMRLSYRAREAPSPTKVPLHSQAESDRIVIAKVIVRNTDMRRLKYLNFTPAGMIKISVYPNEAREYAYSQVKLMKKEVNDIFKLFCSFCLAYCRERQISLNWHMMFNTLRREGFTNESAGLDPSNPVEYENIPTASGSGTVPKRRTEFVPEPVRDLNTPEEIAGRAKVRRDTLERMKTMTPTQQQFLQMVLDAMPE